VRADTEPVLELPAEDVDLTPDSAPLAPDAEGF
jgi:hypothetical protein